MPAPPAAPSQPIAIAVFPRAFPISHFPFSDLCTSANAELSYLFDSVEMQINANIYSGKAKCV